MRRSCAPSVLKEREDKKRIKIDKLFGSDEDSNKEVSTSTLDDDNWGSSSRRVKFDSQNTEENEGNIYTKIIFNVVWREITKKKHKTWDGDGFLEVQLELPRAVLKDSTGRYLGTKTKFEVSNLEEGFQMVIGGKEIELLEQIADKNKYFALRKQQVDNRWGSGESQQSEETTKKIKVSTLYQPPYKLQNNTYSRNIETNKNYKVIPIQEACPSKSAKVTYNVVWREATTKKNKTWDGDGVFEIYTDSHIGILKNERGQEMGTMENILLTEIENGANLVIENKEFEILEKKSENITESTSENKLNSHVRQEKRKGDSKITGYILPLPPKDYMEELNPASLPIHSVQIPHKLEQHLRPHQKYGVSFLYKCVMGFHDPMYRGCLLADDMGLGKTLQCLTLACILLKTGPYGGERVLHRVLVVTPSSLTRNWEKEVSKWLKNERMYSFVVGGKQKLDAYAEQQHIPFVIVSYENLLANISDFQNMTFDMLICDEGHRLKNQSTKIVAALQELNILRRIIITGTPVQNDLREFYSLAEFVNPGIFGTYQEFHSYYELPLQDSQNPDASPAVRDLAFKRTEALMKIADTFVLRRLQGVNGQYLPTKYEYIVFVQPSELQQFMLQKALQLYAQKKETILKDLTPLQLITVLKKICNHPSLVSRTKNPNILTRFLERCLPDCSEMGPFDSAKLELVQHFLIASAVQNHEKCVLVSNHTKTLNMLQGLCDFLKIKCLRLDGSTSVSERNANVEKFNNDSDDSLVFLLSAKAGGVGLNLIGASRLILFDNDWNPATDAQAMSRIWRDGQTRDVHIYRLVTAGCIEEKIFQRQIAKLSLGDCVTENIRRDSNDDTMKFSVEDLMDLFCLQEDYTICQTHESLNCHCDGDGKNATIYSASESARNINTLMKWKHYKPPLNINFMKLACLENASDNIIYIFANKTDSI